MTFEEQLREWVAKGQYAHTMDISVTEYGVAIYLQPMSRYPTQGFSVNGDTVIPLTQASPPIAQPGTPTN